MKDQAIQHRLAERIPFDNLNQSMRDLANKVKAQPDDACAWADYGVALRCAGHIDAAIAAYRRSLRLAPDKSTVLSNLGGALRAAARLDEAVTVLERAKSISPNSTSVRFNLGLAYEDSGDLPKAIHEFDFVLRCEPIRKDAAQQRAFSLLKSGELASGFAAYEERLSQEKHLQRHFEQPKWDGSSFAGKTILLHAEQGFGDTIQFIRYAPLVKELGGTVIVECQKSLQNLVSDVTGVDKVFARGEHLPDFDLQASLMSLPFIMGTKLESVPNAIPYIRNRSTSVPSLDAGRPARLKIGIVWASGHNDIGAHARSVPFPLLTELFAIPYTTFYSLQLGDDARDICRSGCETLVVDLQHRLTDFSKTADAIQQLDVIVSVDTAVAHLSGAMGKPTFVLLPFASEWRWLTSRSDSPWYPTMKLFRQEQPGDWALPIRRIVSEVENLLGNQSSSRVKFHAK